MNSESFQAPTLEELTPLFPAYDMSAFIAQGGMGAVYLGVQRTLDRSVAIKILPRHLGADRDFRESFQAEAKAMAKLNHPNLIGVYDFGEVDGMPFIVMEYVAGTSLHDSCYGLQIEPAEAGRIVVATLRGLHHAHENGILHRDVKPANILLDQRANPKLGDFGLAMASTGESDGLVYGTPGFAAPEVYEGQPDHRSDTYAAAVTLYYLLTSEMPGTPYQHPSQICGCDSRFDRLLATALQPLPDDRHENAEVFAKEIETVLSRPASAFTAGPALAVQPATQLASAKSTGTSIMLATVVVLIAVGAGAFFFLKDTEPSAEESETIVTSPEPPEVQPPAETPPEETPLPEKEVVEKLPPEESKEQTIAEAPQEPAKPLETPKIVEKKVVPVSTFDHADYFARGRSYCRREATPILEPYAKDLVKNIDSLERELKKVIRSSDFFSRDIERDCRNAMEATIKEYDAVGRLPDTLLADPPASFLTVASGGQSQAVNELLSTSLATQVQLDKDVVAKLLPIRQIYLDGIRKQASALRLEHNEIDAAILEHEISTIEESETYFRGILNGEEPEPITPEELMGQLSEDLTIGNAGE